MAKNSVLLLLALPILCVGYLECRRFVLQNVATSSGQESELASIKQALTRERDNAVQITRMDDFWRSGMRMQKGATANVPSRFQDLAEAFQSHGKNHIDLRRFATRIRDGESSELPEHEELRSILTTRAALRNDERDISRRLNSYEAGGSGRRDALVDRLERYRNTTGHDAGFYATCMARIAFCDLQRTYTDQMLNEIHAQFRRWARRAEASLPEANRLREAVAAWQSFINTHPADQAKTEKAITQLAEWKNARFLLGILQETRPSTISSTVQQLRRLGDLLKDESVSARFRETAHAVAVNLCEDVLPLNKPLDTKVLVHSRGAEAPKEVDKTKVVITWRSRSPNRQYLVQSSVHDGISLEEQHENECTIDLAEVECVVVEGAVLEHPEPPRKLLSPTLRSEAFHRYNQLRKDLKWTAGSLRELQKECNADRRLEPELRKAGLLPRISQLLDVVGEQKDLFPDGDT